MAYEWDNKKPTAQMLGRWQPFHDGHYALFEEIFKKTGLKESEVIKIMRKELSPNSFKNWRKRVSGRKAKHRKLNELRNDHSLL